MWGLDTSITSRLQHRRLGSHDAMSNLRFTSWPCPAAALFIIRTFLLIAHELGAVNISQSFENMGQVCSTVRRGLITVCAQCYSRLRDYNLCVQVALAFMNVLRRDRQVPILIEMIFNYTQNSVKLGEP